jgi:hypothetical protein
MFRIVDVGSSSTPGIAMNESMSSKIVSLSLIVLHWNRNIISTTLNAIITNKGVSTLLLFRHCILQC